VSDHVCHAIRCDKAVPPRMLMCARHWNTLPLPAQRIITHHYRPGQEGSKTPSPEYLLAAGCAVALVGFLSKECGELAAMNRIALASKAAQLRGMTLERVEELIGAMGCGQIVGIKA
jgi:hypothetical protein